MREKIPTLHTSAYNEVVARENAAFVAGFRLCVEAVRNIEPALAVQLEADWLVQEPQDKPEPGR